MLTAFSDANSKQNSLKMRMFESPESPQKQVANLGKSIKQDQVTSSLSQAISESKIMQTRPQLTGLKPTNLLKTRKNCDKK